MDCKVKSCAACTRTCWLVHGRKSSSPVVASFFKIMLGDDFSKVMFLPPQFASEMSLLVDESALLEDSNGRQWEVTVSSVNGSLVFHQGWNNFAVSHDLEIGDFVVFFQITESLFVVKIYDKTACERVSFSKRCYQRKRSRGNNISTDKDGPNTSVLPFSDIEVYCMINRDLGGQGEEDRICDLDLSLFETCKYSGREGSSQACVTSGISPLPVAKSVGSGALHSVKNSSWHLLPMSVASKGYNQVSQFQKLGSNSTQMKFGRVSASSIVPTSIGIKNCQSGKRMKVIKEEPEEILSDTHKKETIQMLPGTSNTPTLTGAKDCQSGRIMNAIKAEPVEIKSSPRSQKTIQNASVGSPKLTKSEYFRNVSMSVRQENKGAQVAKTRRAAQIAKPDRVSQVVKTDKVAQVAETVKVAPVAKTDRAAQVAMTDRATQVAMTDRAAQVAKTDRADPVVKTDSVVQVEIAESVDLVGAKNCQTVLKVIEEEPKPMEITSVPCSQETRGDASKDPEDIVPQSTVPQELEVKTEITDLDGSTVPQEPVVKTEITDFDGSYPTLCPQSIDPEVVVKTKIIDVDESSPAFSPLLATCNESFVVRQSLSSKGIFLFLC